MSEGDQRGAASERAFSEAAFEKLHGETFTMLWSFARRISGDEGEAHDVCQKAYLAVWKYWSEGRLHEHPRRLLFRAAERAAIDVVRARARRARLARALPAPDQSATWLGVDLRDALAVLRSEDRTLLLLQAAAGLTYEELA
ncbi:MAG: RNA polymerase sigma factor [Candidatus Limnocylindria bacterium]